MRLEDVFRYSELVVDFSSSELIESTLAAAYEVYKPLLLCTSGWEREKAKKQLNKLSKDIPLAPQV